MEPADPTERMLPAEPSDRIDPAEPTDSTDPAEPIDSTERNEPKLCTDAAEAADRTLKLENHERLDRYDRPSLTLAGAGIGNDVRTGGITQP